MPYQNYQGYQPFAPQRQDVIKVNGRAGAEMYQLAPNSSVLMLDETNNLAWFKMTDGAGYATLKPFSLVPYEEPKPIDAKALEERIARLEEALNDKSDNINVESAKHTTKSRQG